MKPFFISIYLVLVVGLFLIVFFVLPISHELIEEQSDLFIREVSKGSFSLVEERLIDLGDESRKQVLKQFQSRFGYPVRLVKFGEYPVDEEDISDLNKGCIINDDEEDYVLIKRLGDTEFLIVMGGPFPYHGISYFTFVITFALCFLCLAIPAMAWAYLLKRDMEKIEQSGQRIVAGDHRVRAMVSKLSALFQISSFFNVMAEKFQALLASQKDLTNSVSHEIRTPLSRIQFSLEMLGEQSDITENHLKYIKRITKDADEIEMLVDEMLTYAKLESDIQQKITKSEHDIVGWLKSLVVEENKLNSKINIRFENRFKEDTLKVNYEPVSLERALRNLIRNGCCYAQSQVQLILEFHPKRPGSGSSDSALNKSYQPAVVMHIDDDGKGVKPQYYERIFEPFFREDDSRNRQSGGYGLGLAIVKRIIRWHDGKISVTRSPLNGARFTVVFEPK